MEIQESQELDFNSDDYNSFYYTTEKQIKKMDDEYILSKVTEMYPDFRKTNNENVLKQVILVIVSDNVLIERMEQEYDIPPTELFKIIYRNYDFIFNKCFITRVQKTIKNKKYARKAARKGCRARCFERHPARKARGRKSSKVV